MPVASLSCTPDPGASDDDKELIPPLCFPEKCSDGGVAVYTRGDPTFCLPRNGLGVGVGRHGRVSPAPSSLVVSPVPSPSSAVPSPPGPFVRPVGVAPTTYTPRATGSDPGPDTHGVRSPTDSGPALSSGDHRVPGRPIVLGLRACALSRRVLGVTSHRTRGVGPRSSVERGPYGMSSDPSVVGRESVDSFLSSPSRTRTGSSSTTPSPDEG